MGITKFYPNCRKKEVQTDNSTICSRLTLTSGLCKAAKEMEMREQDFCEVFCNVIFMCQVQWLVI